MAFSLEAVHVFLAAVEQGSFSAAARHLGKAQSAVSTTINNLELDLGVELFDRSKRSPVLTEAGKHLLRDAKYLNNTAEAFRKKALDIEAGESPKISIAVDPSVFPMEYIYQSCQALADQHPSIELEVLRAASADIIPLIKHRRVQLGVLGSSEELFDIHFQSLRHVHSKPIAHPDHPLAQQKNLSFGDFHNHRQISYTSHSKSELFDPISSSVWLIQSAEDVLNLLLNNMGWAFFPLDIAQTYLANGQLIELDCDFQQNTSLLPVIAAWHPDTPLNSPSKTLLNYLADLSQ